MKGTLHTLQLLFELPVNEESREIEKEYKIFDVCCLSNACLYRLRKEGASETQGCDGEKMEKNSLSHFKETIRILKPQIVILQGTRAESMVDQAYGLDKEHKRNNRYHIINENGKWSIAESENIPEVGMIEAHIDKINLSHGETLFLSLYHPSARGKRGYASPERAENYLRFPN